jgi:membrane protein insertase Oxa1/YidC/SpoIIIJ
MQQTMALYRQHELSVVDSKSMLGALVQMPVIYGLYRALSNGVDWSGGSSQGSVTTG